MSDDGVDVLVSNAGICPFAEFLTMPHATWDRTRSVNLDGTFYITQGKDTFNGLEMTQQRDVLTTIKQLLRTK